MAKGYIHSIESMGMVDGPGVRCVVFMQGCAMRCQYCHNPDTWKLQVGEEVEAKDLFAKILRFRPYFESSGGGVTFSGGEPLLQKEFLTEMLQLCKAEGIHTAIDTAGGGMGDFGEILDLADLLLLDIKHTNEEKYRELTGISIGRYEFFVSQLKEHPVDVWLRAVIIPGINDNDGYIQDLWEAAKQIPNVKKIELLPYHTMGVKKYEAMGMPYPLEGVPAMDRKKVAQWQEKLNKALIETNF
ncbi:MAG: pyruvate formate lyase-activating protein [Clostridia bacterium]|nr:pyruvate formate lyase-activating protein [Clostridia bacterium]MBQ2940943.1 pyruvate formate lyase-activating protein [Clostridia bacterium]